MTAYFLSTSRAALGDLTARLGQLIVLRPIDSPELPEAASPGDVLIATGESLVTLSVDSRDRVKDSLLGAGVHLVVMPPFAESSIWSPISGVKMPHCYAAPFGPVRICDADLAGACGLLDLTILYQQALRTSLGKPVIVTDAKDAVMIQYQHRSTWGYLVCTSLLIGSTSSRSVRGHRAALLQGLVSWLGSLSAGSIVRERSERSSRPELGSELPVTLLAAYLAQHNGVLSAEQLASSVSRVCARLDCQADTLDANRALERLEAQGIVLGGSDNSWMVDAKLLISEISRLHLGSYLRRLQ